MSISNIKMAVNRRKRRKRIEKRERACMDGAEMRHIMGKRGIRAQAGRHGRGRRERGMEVGSRRDGMGMGRRGRGMEARFRRDVGRMVQALRTGWERKKALAWFGMVVLCWHAVMVPCRDDLFFANAARGESLWAFLARRYEGWTSRLLIEGLLVLLSRRPLLWAALDCLAFLLAGRCLLRLLSLDEAGEEGCSALVLGSFFLIPAEC